MGRYFKIFICSLAIICCYADELTGKDYRLWYNSPAKVWEEALPLGNGHLGAMLFGNPTDELYQLNDEALWSGGPSEWNNPLTKEHLGEVRQAIGNRDYKKAGDLWKKYGQGPYTARYLPLANMRLKFDCEDDVSEFYRDLDISEATASVKYKSGDVVYTRKSFISNPDSVMVVRLTADKCHSLSFRILLDTQLRTTSTTARNASLTLSGDAPVYVANRAYDPRQIVYGAKGEGLTFEVEVRAVVNGGSVKAVGDSCLVVTNADDVTLLLAAATNYEAADVAPSLSRLSPSKIVDRRLAVAEKKGYGNLFVNHVADYQNLFNRVALSLGSRIDRSDCPTDRRLRMFASDDSDQGLVELYYQYGRYLSIASSRPGGLPSNLQGI